MRIASVGHAIFAATMIGLGILGLIQGGFTPVWAPVPDGLPARQVLVYLCAFISLASGIGLLWQRTAAPAARVLLAYLLLWFLLLRVREIILSPTFGVFWPGFETAVIVAAAWVLYIWFAADWDRRYLGFATGDEEAYHYDDAADTRQAGRTSDRGSGSGRQVEFLLRAG